MTVPSAVILPVTGVWMAHQMRYPLTSGFVGWAFLLYGVAGLTWLPAAYLQIQMRRMAEESREAGVPLPPAYHTARRIWFALGVPAFVASVLAVYLMVARQMIWHLWMG